MSYYDNVAQVIGAKLSKQKPLVDKITIKKQDPDEIAPVFKESMWRGMPVYYDDIKHLYFTINRNSRIPFISVTTFIALFIPKFDEKYQSKRCSKKDNYNCLYLNRDNWMTLPHELRQKRILQAWKENNEIANLEGTALHAGFELIAKKDIEVEKAVNILKLGYKHVRPTAPRLMAQVKDFLSTFKDYKLLAEPVLANLIIGMAGQADVVLIGRKIIILDYKTNRTNPQQDKTYDNMLGIFGKFPNNAWTHYNIQIAIYAYMLIQEYDLEVEAYLIWMDEDIYPISLDVNYYIRIVTEVFKRFRDNKVWEKAYQIMKHNGTSN